MTAKERKKDFLAYLKEKYNPLLSTAQSVYKMHDSLSNTLVGLGKGFTTVFEIDEIVDLNELLKSVENPSNGVMAYGRQIKNLDLKKAFIKHYSSFLSTCSTSTPKIIPEQTDEKEDEKYLEGQLKETKFFKRKRSRALRDECLRKYGVKCYVCQFDFEKVYGERGKGYIEVHHLNPMANYDDEHSISADDLRPLCSNCHSMIHKDPLGGVTDIDIFKKEFHNRNN